MAPCPLRGANFQRTSTEPQRLEALFVPAKTRKPAPAGRTESAGAVTGTVVTHGQDKPGGSFQNFGTPGANANGTAPAGLEPSSGR